HGVRSPFRSLGTGRGLLGLRDLPGRRELFRGGRGRRFGRHEAGDAGPTETAVLGAELPAAPEGAVDVDQVEGNVALRDGQLILLLDVRGFQLEDGVEGDDAGAVLVHADLRGRHG